MNKNNYKFFVATLFVLIFLTFADGQNLKRTTYKNESIEFGAGGTLTIVGAPKGSISVEGWTKNEVEVSAEIEIEAANEADLALLAAVNGFAIDQQFGHIRILTVGTNDKEFMKRTAKKFPKRLLNMPFKIDFKVKVPTYCDLDINSGTGNLAVSNVDGSMQIKAFESDANLDLIGGTVSATFGTGKVNVKINPRSWRGKQAMIQLASGALNVEFPQNMNADIDASILRIGKIENLLTDLKPRNRSKFSDTQMLAKAGSGGALLSFTVGDGSLKLSNW